MSNTCESAAPWFVGKPTRGPFETERHAEVARTSGFYRFGIPPFFRDPQLSESKPPKMILGNLSKGGVYKSYFKALLVYSVPKSWPRWSARAVAHAQDHYAIGIDPIADDVGADNRALAQLGAGNLTAAIGEGGKAVGRLDDLRGHATRGIGVEISDVAADALKVGQGPRTSRRPASPRLGNGARQFVRLAPRPQPLHHMLMWHNPARGNIGLGLGNRSRLGIGVDLVKYGFRLCCHNSP